MSDPRLRPDILDFEPYSPGLSIDEIKERYGLTRVVKLASNENPLGAPPLARKAAERAIASGFRYPRNLNPGLVSAIAAKINAPLDQVLAGHGSDEMIDLLLRVVCRPGVSNVVCWDKAFSMYRLTAKLCGVEYRAVPRGPDLALPLDGLAAACDADTAAVFVTSPDNPTGLTATTDELAALADKLPANTLLALDEAYIDFARPVERFTGLPLALARDNVVVLRTFSKFYGLAGFRLGYGVFPRTIADYMTRARIPFTVGIVDEAAGLAALEDAPFLAATLAAAHQSLDAMAQGLAALSCRVWPTQANFLMFQPPKPGRAVFQGLLERGIITRHLASFGLPDMIRVNAGTADETALFLETLGAVLRG